MTGLTFYGVRSCGSSADREMGTPGLGDSILRKKQGAPPAEAAQSASEEEARLVRAYSIL